MQAESASASAGVHRPVADGLRSAARETAMIVLAIAASLVAAALLLLALGHNPFDALRVMLETVFWSRSGFVDTVLQAVPLLLIGLGYVIAFRARIWMVGGEGQFHVGASAAGAVVLTLPAATPPVAALALGMGAAVAAGALWAVVPGVLRVRLEVNEVVSTLMLNFVGILVMSWLVRAALPDPLVPLLQTPAFPEDFVLPAWGNTRLHAGLLILPLAVAVVAYLAHGSLFGARARAVGANPLASRAAGVDVSRTIMTMFLLGGALAGLAAGVHVLGATHRLLIGISNEYGYTAILVALLARNQPLAVIPAAFFFSALIVGAEAVQVDLRVPSDFILVLMGIIVLLLMAIETLTRRRA